MSVEVTACVPLPDCVSSCASDKDLLQPVGMVARLDRFLGQELMTLSCRNLQWNGSLVRAIESRCVSLKMIRHDEHVS